MQFRLILSEDNYRTSPLITLLCNRYEDLKLDTSAEVMKMLDYLNFDYEPGEVERRLGIDYGRFHRYTNMKITRCTIIILVDTIIGSIKETIFNITQSSRDF